MSLPKRHKKLLTPEGFDELFEREIPKFDTHGEAFEELWLESIIVYGYCLYDGYDAFLEKTPSEIEQNKLYKRVSLGLPDTAEDTITVNKGNVYIFADFANEVCKIGFSTNIKARLDKAQRFYPSKLEMVCVFRNKQMSFEKELHRKFKEYRLEREWFEIAGELETFINSNRI